MCNCRDIQKLFGPGSDIQMVELWVFCFESVLLGLGSDVGIIIEGSIVFDACSQKLLQVKVQTNTT